MALEKLGPYKLVGILGRGGMGTVYRGVHNTTEEVHAVKVLSPTYADDDHFRNRFESEIKALIKLDHPNIVRLLSYGQDQGLLFFAMELVDGRSLFEMHRDSYKFSWREILKIAKETASGLRHAHDRGVIHRDLKPGNLLWSKDNDVKITDFGIAKRFGNSQNTGENVLGTLDYMSPEQAKGEPVTVKSDLYSLGTVLFTLLSGKAPFSNKSVEQSLRNLTEIPPPRLRSVVPDVPEEIDHLVRKLMDKDPRKRVQTAQALLHMITGIEENLKRYSEAKTAENPPIEKGDKTYEERPKKKKGNNTISDHTVQDVESTGNRSGNTGDGAARTLHDENENEPLPAGKDFFSTVTEGQRKPKSYIELQEQKKPVWQTTLLACAFAAMVAIGGYGIYRAYRIPSVEELYSTIEASIEKPNRVSEELKLFVKHYPDDVRIIEINQLNGIAKAMALVNTLSVRDRSSTPGQTRLTQIEKQFLDIAKLAEQDAAAAYSRMSAFATLYKDEEDITVRDQRCIDAAKSYMLKIRHDVVRKISFHEDQISAAMDRAKKKEGSQAAEIYESIIDLYKDHDWAKAMVEKAQSLLDELRAQE